MPETLGTSLAWMVWARVPKDARDRQVEETMRSRINEISVAMRQAEPSERAEIARNYRGAPRRDYVRTLDIDRAALLGWIEGDEAWPIELRSSYVEGELAQRNWRGMTDDGRRRALRSLLASEKGAKRASA
jgi:hypothetical protein